MSYGQTLNSKLVRQLRGARGSLLGRVPQTYLDRANEQHKTALKRRKLERQNRKRGRR